MTVPAGALDTVLGALTEVDLVRASVGGGMPMRPNGKPFTSDAIKEVYLVTVADGRYWVSMTNPTDSPPMWVMGAGPGGIYELDLGAIAEDVLGRRPEPTTLDELPASLQTENLRPGVF